MSNYLKKILFSLLIFMMPYMNSASKAAGNEEESSSIHHTCTKMRVVEEDQSNASSPIKLSTPLKTVSLEEPQRSWTSYASSYASSSVKSAAWTTYNILDSAIRNPRQAVFVALLVAAQCVDGRCACYCWSNSSPKFFGYCVSDMTDCKTSCTQLGYQAIYCIDKDKGC